MRNYSNNFMDFKKPNKHCDFRLISKKMADLHSLCFQESVEQFTAEKMFSLLKDHKHHIFFNEISLAIILVLDSEADLISLMVNPLKQKTGIASNLLELITQYLKDLGIRKLFLEVDVTNDAAIKIYNRIGFTTCGIRKSYFQRVMGN